MSEKQLYDVINKLTEENKQLKEDIDDYIEECVDKYDKNEEYHEAQQWFMAISTKKAIKILKGDVQ